MKKENIKWVIVALALGIVAYIVYKSKNKAREGASPNALPDGCYPMEEVHETNSGKMWVSIIPFLADGTTSARPPENAINIGDQFSVTNTGSALDQQYTVHSIYYGADGRIGSLLVDKPSGYNYNYNAWQGDGDPRDMTYFGIGQICLN
jgi:hypothetical protein